MVGCEAIDSLPTCLIACPLPTLRAGLLTVRPGPLLPPLFSKNENGGGKTVFLSLFSQERGRVLPLR